MKTMFMVYVALMIFIAGMFLGNEISMLQNASTVNHANNKLKQCSEVIARNK